MFAQPGGDTARAQLRAVVDQLTPQAPAFAERLQAMEADVLADTRVPGRVLVEDLVEQPERTVDRELKRRADVVGILRTRPP